MLVENKPIDVKFDRDLEEYFTPFRENIVGNNLFIKTARHESIRMLYADWTASGRCYRPIEEKLLNEVMPLIGNTHTESNYVGSYITDAYQKARHLIKKHVNANDDDILISYGSGMTDVVNRFQRILELRVHEKYRKLLAPEGVERPVVFVTHMEHHSNHTSWLETLGDVVVVPPDSSGLVSIENFETAIKIFEDRSVKIAAITACSNVTGIISPYHEIARLIHRYEGYCFVDFASSAPYVDIDMHPTAGEPLDAIYFSPHKFLGGPGSSGILIFNSSLYHNMVPDVCGGGTVDWTNPWGGRKYLDDIESREDGGTPAILQTIKAAYAIQLKEEMGTLQLLERESGIVRKILNELASYSKIHVLARQHQERLGIISFHVEGVHYNDAVRRLSDQFGIQTRGGCSCAQTYGHYLFGVNKKRSKEITDLIDVGDVSQRLGWVRASIHPTMTNLEVDYLLESIKSLAEHSIKAA